MPSAQAKPLHASSLQQELLQKMAHRTTSAQRLVKRAQIVLEALKGTSNTSIDQHLQIDDETVRRWRDRWQAGEPRLQAIEETGNRLPRYFREAVLERLFWHGSRIFDTQEVADRLRVKPSTVRRWIYIGALEAKTIQRGRRNRHRIKKAVIDAIEQPTASPAPD